MAKLYPRFWGDCSTYNMNYPQALANKLAHTDLSPGLSDFTITLSSNTAAPIPINFYFGLDGNTPTNKLDFVSTVLHEIGHGLGFWPSVYKANTTSPITYKYSNGYPTIYDNFLRDGNNVRLTSLASPSTALTNFAQSDNLFFDGFNAISGNGGTAPRLYAPNPFQSGSSISHLREASYPNPNPNRLMTPFLDYGEAIHDIGYVSHGIMSDLGWDMESWVGFEDHLGFVTPIPVLLTQGQPYTYNCMFHDEIPYGAWMSSYNWKLDLQTNTAPITILTRNTLDPLLSFTLPTLPALLEGYYLRNYNGTVRAKLKVYGTDNQGYYHECIQDVGVYYLPDPPLLQKVSSSCNIIKVSFFSQGATSYMLYYGPSSGVPYANIITIPAGINTYTIALPPYNNTYYVNVRGVNQTGTSIYGNEVSRTCNTNPIDKKISSDEIIADEGLQLTIYPNPAENFVNISTNIYIVNGYLKIYASDGKLISEKYLRDISNEKVDIVNYPKGIYLIHLTNVKGETAIGRFVKN